MKAKVNCSRLLKAVFAFQQSGIKITAQYRYSRNAAVPSFITINLDKSRTLKAEQFSVITNNGYVLFCVRMTPDGVNLEVVFERGTV